MNADTAMKLFANTDSNKPQTVRQILVLLGILKILKCFIDL